MTTSRTLAQKPSSQSRQIANLKSMKLPPMIVAILQQMLQLEIKKEKFENEAESAQETEVRLADLPP
jgi:hypothetical protein